MPIEEDVFYDINGYEVSRTNLVQQMIQYYEEKVALGESKVTDFNEGSEIRNLLESICVDVYALMEDQNDLTKIAFVETAEGEWLDKHGANPFVNLARDTGNEATGFVTFSIPDVGTNSVVIPEGTVVVSTDNGLDYVTDSECTIAVGDTNVLCSATCITVGEDGNCPANTVTLIEDNFIDVPGLSVNNTEAFTGGTDYEEDDEYRERLLAFLRKDDFGSLPYYENLCTNVQGVHDVLLVDATGYTKKVLVNGNVKPTPDTVLAEVLEVLSIPDNIVLGHTFTVDKPDYITKNLTLNLTVSEEVDEDLLEDIFDSIFDGKDLEGEISFDGMSIGQSLLKETLYNAFYLIDEVSSVCINVTGSSSEISDLTVDADEVLKLGTLTINQTVSEE